jgi:hypothetical protein
MPCNEFNAQDNRDPSGGGITQGMALLSHSPDLALGVAMDDGFSVEWRSNGA